MTVQKKERKEKTKMDYEEEDQSQPMSANNGEQQHPGELTVEQQQQQQQLYQMHLAAQQQQAHLQQQAQAQHLQQQMLAAQQQQQQQQLQLQQQLGAGLIIPGMAGMSVDPNASVGAAVPVPTVASAAGSGPAAGDLPMPSAKRDRQKVLLPMTPDELKKGVSEYLRAETNLEDLNRQRSPWLKIKKEHSAAMFKYLKGRVDFTQELGQGAGWIKLVPRTRDDELTRAHLIQTVASYLMTISCQHCQHQVFATKERALNEGIFCADIIYHNLGSATTFQIRHVKPDDKKDRDQDVTVIDPDVFKQRAIEVQAAVQKEQLERAQLAQANQKGGRGKKNRRN